MPVTNVLISGVGGQGAVLASELIALAAVEAGHDVKQGEFHGVAQRGGAVFSHVRFGDRVRSPIARQGTVDYLVALDTETYGKTKAEAKDSMKCKLRGVSLAWYSKGRKWSHYSIL